ncbi:hypothetical protein GEV33_005357 [Tenebrio molitor]|uniref:Uncharacterized protein n=1 Tax=Tenebrio molitor TaxID=7067 RepID=A0A8J6LCQ6_TENMO|nr:hypothetical protein GEV33_005357 [Tenebrio molitor]
MPPVRTRAHYQHVTQLKEAALLECEKQVFPIGQSLIVLDEMWLLCYGVVVPGLKKEDTSDVALALVLPLTPNHRGQRLAWCNERIAWDKQWNSIIFSDESRFCLGMHDGRRRVRRLRGERRNFAFSIERPVARTVGGNLTAIRYAQEFLRPVVVPYFRRVNNALFQQDNARPHIANVSIDFLDDSQVDLLPWSPRSRDLSPIEHVWNLMGRRLTNLHNPPLTLAALRHEIQVGWDSVPQDEINHLIRMRPTIAPNCVEQFYIISIAQEDDGEALDTLNKFLQVDMSGIEPLPEITEEPVKGEEEFKVTGNTNVITTQLDSYLAAYMGKQYLKRIVCKTCRNHT